LTGALHDSPLQLSPPLPSSLAVIKPANPSSPGQMAVKVERVRERERGVA